MTEGGEPACWAHLLGPVEGGTASALGPGQLAALVESLADAVIVADRAGRIVFWNESASRMLGWSAGEALGQPLDLIVPEKHRPAHNAGYQRVIQQGTTRYGDSLLQVPAMHRDGQRLSVAFTVTLLWEADRVVGVAAVMRDETARRAHEQELRRAAAANQPPN